MSINSLFYYHHFNFLYVYLCLLVKIVYERQLRLHYPSRAKIG